MSGIIEGASEVVAALVRIADALDRAVFLAEAVAVEIGLVWPEDVGMTREGPDEQQTADE